MQQRAVILQEYAPHNGTVAPGQQVCGYRYTLRCAAADGLVVQTSIVSH